MAIETPDILLCFDDGSGSNVTNYGSLSPSTYAIGGTESTDWSWVDGGNALDDYLQLKDSGASSSHGYVTLSTSTLSTTSNKKVAIAFKISVNSLPSTPGYLVTAANFDQGLAAIYIETGTGGDFDLHLEFQARNYAVIGDEITGLSFNTPYSIVMTVEKGTGDTADWKYKINSDSVVTGNDSCATGPIFNQNLGRLNSGSFTTHYGAYCKWYYFTFWDDISAVLSDAEMGNINSDPAAYIPNWPSLLSPDVGSITSSGYAPTLQIQSGPIYISVDVGSITTTGQTPTADTTSSKVIPIDQGSQQFTTYNLTLGKVIEVPAGDGPEDVFPDDTNVGITGYIPLSGQTYNLQMGVNNVVITTYAPSADVQAPAGIYIPVDVGTITATGYAPDDINAHVPSPSTGTITFASYTPTVDVTHVRAIDVGSITTTTYSPSVSADSNTAILMSVGAATYTGYAPSLSFGIGRHPDAGSITFTSYTPDAISEDVSWEFFPDQSDSTITGYSFTFELIEVNKIINIGAGTLIIPGWKVPFGTEPSVEIGVRQRRKLLGILKR